MSCDTTKLEIAKIDVCVRKCQGGYIVIEDSYEMIGMIHIDNKEEALRVIKALEMAISDGFLK